MITGADVRGGYRQGREKSGYNSILPYLRSKQAEKAEAERKASPKPTSKKRQEKDPEEDTVNTEETYREAIHSIVQGE